MVEMEEGSFLKGNWKDCKQGGEANCAKHQAVTLYLLR